MNALDAVPTEACAETCCTQNVTSKKQGRQPHTKRMKETVEHQTSVAHDTKNAQVASLSQAHSFLHTPTPPILSRPTHSAVRPSSAPSAGGKGGLAVTGGVERKPGKTSGDQLQQNKLPLAGSLHLAGPSFTHKMTRNNTVLQQTISGLGEQYKKEKGKEGGDRSLSQTPRSGMSHQSVTASGTLSGTAVMRSKSGATPSSSTRPNSRIGTEQRKNTDKPRQRDTSGNSPREKVLLSNARVCVCVCVCVCERVLVCV